MSDVFVAVIGGKGCPGATTTALALAAVSDQPSYMVEADSFGGDLAYRCRRAGLPLPESPTVLTAATAVRHGSIDEVLSRYSHSLTDHLRLLPGHLVAEQSFSTDWHPLAEALVSSSQPVFADVGRVHSASPTISLVKGADVVVPVVRADVTSVARMLDQLDRLVPKLAAQRGAVPNLIPVVIAPARHAQVVVRELRELLTGSRVAPAVRDVGWIAYDETGAERLYAGRTPRGRLASSTRDLRAQLHETVKHLRSPRASASGQAGAAHAGA